MKILAASQVDIISENIAALQLIKKKLISSPEHIEQGLLQQYLDQESLYIKQVPRASFESGDEYRTLTTCTEQ